MRLSENKLSGKKQGKQLLQDCLPNNLIIFPIAPLLSTQKKNIDQKFWDEGAERNIKSKVKEGVPVIYPGKRLRLPLTAVVEQIAMLFSCSMLPAVLLLLPSRSMALFLTNFQGSIF